MKTHRLSVLVISLATFAAGSSAYAAPNVLKACKKDMKKFGCTATTEAEAHDCIEKNEKEGKKNEGLSKSCYKAHEAYEKKTGKQETEETQEKSPQEGSATQENK